MNLPTCISIVSIIFTAIFNRYYSPIRVRSIDPPFYNHFSISYFPRIDKKKSIIINWRKFAVNVLLTLYTCSPFKGNKPPFLKMSTLFNTSVCTQSPIPCSKPEGIFWIYFHKFQFSTKTTPILT